jgi:hypothetical protein
MTNAYLRRLSIGLASTCIALIVIATATTASAASKYKVRVESSPAGATVYINSKDKGAVGITPWEGTLAKGTYTVIVELHGYAPATRQLKVARTRKLQSVFVPLTRQAEPPRIDVTAAADQNVHGATVYLDDDAQGTAPVLLTTTPGKHQVKLRKEGYEEFSTWVTVKEDEKASVSPVLKAVAKPKLGTVVVEADVRDAEVLLDGNKVGTTPTVINDVLEGIHVVEVRKEPAIPWKQTIQVHANEQVKIRAELAATIGGGGGAIRVLSNVTGARVFLDGTDMGEVPIDIKDVKSGEHVIEVRASGYQTREERVTVNNGSSTVLKLDLNRVAAAEAKIKVVSSIPNADVYIDGAPVGKVPVEEAVSSGKHFIRVSLDGYKTFEAEITIEPGQVKTVPAELKQVSRLRVISNPPGAIVLINGIVQDQRTPIELNELEVGKTFVQVEMSGYRTITRDVNLEGGKPMETLSFDLELQGMTDDELIAEQRGLASFGARTLPRGRATFDLSVGYPYLSEIKVSVGAGKAANFGLDAGVGVRTFFARTELGLGVRLMLYERDPFTLGAFSDLWYGSRLLDDSKRNGLTWNVGPHASLTAFGKATITGRLYLNAWNDRHCPSLSGNEFEPNSDPVAACRHYRERVVVGGGTSPLAERMEALTGLRGREMFDRETGARIMASIIAEIAIYQQWNAFFIFESATAQGERALYTDPFSNIMLKSDYRIYARGGATYKF